MSSNDFPLEPSAGAASSDGDGDELLSAYLDGELGADDAAALEARLDTDSALAQRLDAVADTLVALRGLDDVEVPDGFSQRLAAALGSDVAADAPVENLNVRRARRTARRAAGRGRSWAALSGVAAALVAVAVLSIDGFPGPQDRATSEMALEAMEEGAGGAAQDAAPPAAGEAAEDSAGAAAQSGPRPESGEGTAEQDLRSAPAYGDDQSTESAQAQPAPAALPVLVDAGLVVADATALEEVYTGLPEATDLLGLELTQARERAAANTAAIREAGPFPDSGLLPAACLDTVSAGAEGAAEGQDGPSVPVRVEALRYQVEQALAYVVVSASAGSDALDQVQVWVVDPASCATQQLLTVTGG